MRSFIASVRICQPTFFSRQIRSPLNFSARVFDIAARAETFAPMYEASGKIKMVGEVQSFASGFTKREFVVTTANDKFPQDLKFEVVKDKCTILDAYKTGDDVQVTFDIRGNEYNGKYFVNLSCFKLQGSGGSGESSSSSRSAPRSQAAPSGEPSMADLRDDDDFDDVPF